jgi:hypothetical protein
MLRAALSVLAAVLVAGFSSPQSSTREQGQGVGEARKPILEQLREAQSRSREPAAPRRAPEPPPEPDPADPAAAPDAPPPEGAAPAAQPEPPPPAAKARPAPPPQPRYRY